MQRSSAISAGHEQTGEKSLQGAEMIGRIKAAQGASGVDANTGSAVDVRGSQRAANLLSAQTTLSNAQRSAWGYQQQELGFSDQANLYKGEAQSDQSAGMIKAATGVVGGLGGLAGPLGGTGMFGGASPVASGGGGLDFGVVDDANDLGFLS
jgi:hypothetical protein